MKTVTVEKDALREAVEANREAHHEIFLEALDGYQDQALTLLAEHMERIKKGKIEKVAIMLPFPEDHTRDYDRVLKMIEMSIDDEFELEEHEFAEYVMDDWGWKRQFLTSNMSYSKRAEEALTWSK